MYVGASCIQTSHGQTASRRKYRNALVTTCPNSVPIISSFRHLPFAAIPVSINPAKFVGWTWAVVATHCAGGQTLGGFVRTLSRNTPQLERNFKPSPARSAIGRSTAQSGCARVWTEIVCSLKSLVWLALANHRVYTAGGGADRQKPICIMSVGAGWIVSCCCPMSVVC